MGHFFCLRKIFFIANGLVLLIMNRLNMRYAFIILILALVFSGQAKAQNNEKPVRVEFNARAEVFKLVPCGEKGALMFYQSVKDVDPDTKAWVFIFYDKNLEPLWSKEIGIFKDFAFRKEYLDNETLHLVFQKEAKPRNDEHNLQLLTFDVLTGESKFEGIFTPENARMINFQVYGKYFVAGFNYPKESALFLIRDLEKGEDLPTIFSENPTFIEDVKVDPENQSVLLAVNVYTSRKNSSLYVNTYDFSGNLASSVFVAPTRESEKLINAQLSFPTADEIFVLGSYNNMNGSVTYNEEAAPGEESEGFYIAKIKADKQQFIRFHELLDFKNITEILNNEELANVQNLIKKEKKKGRPQSLYYDFLIHDLKKNGDGFLLLAEAYYPEYHQVSTMSYDFYGRPMPYYYNVFDGYRYFNAFAVSVDREGNLQWSNGIKIWDKRSMDLRKSVEAFVDSNTVVMFYNHSGKIYSKVVEGYDQLGNVEKTRISTKNISDIQMESSEGMIRHWYGDAFLAYGYQTLRNSEVGGGSKRRVFYFNKLVFN